MTTRIVFSTDQNPTYAFFAPLASKMWQRVAGFQPLILTVGPVSEYILGKTRETGADVVAVDLVEGLGSGALAQFSRLYAYLLPTVQADDYLLTVDVDAFPLQREAFQPSGALVDLMFPNWMHPFFSVGYIGMKAATWTEVMGQMASSISDAIAHLNATHPLIAQKRTEGITDPFFNFDEHYITERIRAWRGFPGECHQVPRVGGDLLNDRIDRIRWPRTLPDTPRLMRMVDAHLLRPGWLPENWPRLRDLMARYLSPADMAWCDEYQREWVNRGH